MWGPCWRIVITIEPELHPRVLAPRVVHAGERRADRLAGGEPGVGVDERRVAQLERLDAGGRRGEADRLDHLRDVLVELRHPQRVVHLVEVGEERPLLPVLDLEVAAHLLRANRPGGAGSAASAPRSPRRGSSRPRAGAAPPSAGRAGAPRAPGTGGRRGTGAALGSRAHVSTAPGRAATAAGAFPAAPKSGSIGAFRAPALSDPLPPAFDTWFAGRCPEIPLPGARAVLELAAEGATVPFITRYRKERTGGPRRGGRPPGRSTRRSSSRQILSAPGDHRRVDRAPREAHPRAAGADPRHLRPRRPRGPLPPLPAAEEEPRPRRARGGPRAARRLDLGLRPRDARRPQEGQTLELWAFTFRNEEKGVPDAKSAIEGARDILVERLAGTAGAAGRSCAAPTSRTAALRATKTEKAKPHSKFETYFAFQETVALAARAGELAPLPRGAARPGGGRAPALDRRAARRRRVRGAARGRLRGGRAARCPTPRGPRCCATPAGSRSRTTCAPRSRTRCTGCSRRWRTRRPSHVFAENVRRRLLERALRAEGGARRRPGHPHRVQARRGGRGRASSLATEVVHLQDDEQRPARPRDARCASSASTRRRRSRSGNGTGGREAEVFVRERAARGRASSSRSCS